ncbi:hypothetical protein [Faecalimonas umbilicata]
MPEIKCIKNKYAIFSSFNFPLRLSSILSNNLNCW